MNYSEMMIAEIQNGNLDKVEEQLELALQFDDSDTLYLLGNTLFQLGFLIETKKVYNHLIDKHPEDDELKIYLAEIEIEDGNELEALNLLHTIDPSSSAYAQSLLVQADYYHLNGLPEVSIQKLLEAEERLPEEEVIKFALGEVYYSMADYQNAIKYYEMLTTLGYDEVSGTLISVRLGSCYVMIGEYEKALAYLEEALTLKADPEVYYQIGLVYVQQEEYDKAIEPLTKAKELDPSLSSVYILLAETYERQNHLEKALEEIESSFSINEFNIDFYFKAAEIAVKLKDYTKAAEYYKQAINLGTDNDRAIIKYAEFLNYMDEYEEVVDLLEHSSATIQQLPQSLWLLANAYNQIDEYDKARSFYEQASTYLMTELDFLKEYAFFLREDGQRDKMKQVAQSYLNISTEPDIEMEALLYDDYNDLIT